MTEEDIKIIEDLCEAIPSTCLNGSGEACPSCIKVRKARSLIARLREKNRKAGAPATSPSPDTRRVWKAETVIIIDNGVDSWCRLNESDNWGFGSSDIGEYEKDGYTEITGTPEAAEALASLDRQMKGDSE